MRYKKFKGLYMSLVVSPADRRLFYCNLLPLEASLVCGDTIGPVAHHPFNFKVLDEHPLRQDYIPYSPAETDWIEDYLQSQAELGTLRRVTRQDEDPLFISSVVLVKEGQSGQKYHPAPNLEEVNSQVQLPVHPMVDF